METKTVLMVKSPSELHHNKSAEERIHLSLGDGMGAALYVMKAIGADITWSIGVEKSEEKKRICNNVHPPMECPLGGVDHS